MLVVLGGGCDQFGKTKRGQQTGGDARCKGCADLGQYGQARPQGVAGGGVRISRKRIKKQISAAMARKVIGKRHAPGEDEAIGRDASA